MGLADSPAEMTAVQHILYSLAGKSARIGIGYNSTSAFSGFACATVGAGASRHLNSGAYELVPNIGINTATFVEDALSSTPDYVGTELSMLMTIKWMG